MYARRSRQLRQRNTAINCARSDNMERQNRLPQVYSLELKKCTACANKSRLTAATKLKHPLHLYISPGPSTSTCPNCNCNTSAPTPASSCCSACRSSTCGAFHSRTSTSCWGSASAWRWMTCDTSCCNTTQLQRPLERGHGRTLAGAGIVSSTIL